MLFWHGFIRSYSLRLFQFVFLFFFVAHFNFPTSYGVPSSAVPHSYDASIFLVYAVALFINFAGFPEFGFTFIGTTVVSALEEVQVRSNNSVGL